MDKSKKVKMWTKSVEEAIRRDDTSFFDGEFKKSEDFLYIRNEEGASLLHFAVQQSRQRMVKYFLDKGLGELAGLMNSGETVLHQAVKFYNYTIVELLLKHGFPIDDMGAVGYSPLFLAAKTYSGQYVHKFPEPDIIFHLVRRGANVNTVSENNDTPLHQAIAHGAELLVTLYLGRGADLNLRDQDGYTALQFAAEQSHAGIVELLVNAGANVNNATHRGRTPLHLAAGDALCPKSVDLLIRSGADVNAVDESGKTPLFMAIGGEVYDDDEDDDDEDENDDEEEELDPVLRQRIYYITRSLLDAGAEVNAINTAGRSAFHQALIKGLDEVIQLFLERGADIYARNAEGLSSLHIAVECASFQVAYMLIDRGISINVRSPIGVTPLHVAAEHGREMHIKLLLAKGADINVTDILGYTPLHYAALFFPRDAGKVINIVYYLLLVVGADPFAKAKDGKTPLDYAVENANGPMIDALLRRLAHLEAWGDSRATEVVNSGIGNDNQWLSVYEKHQREIVVMKEEKIHGKVSYYDMVRINLDTLVRNYEFVKAFKSNEVIKEFEFYDKVSKKFHDALKRKVLTDLAVEYLSDMLCPLPILVLERILSYHKLEELEEFVELCQNQFKPPFSETSRIIGFERRRRST